MIKKFTEMKKEYLTNIDIKEIKEQDMFYYYEKIIFNDEYSILCDFLIIKKQYSSILLKERLSGIKVYFSDLDIIEMVLEVEKQSKEIFFEIINGLKDIVYKREMYEYNFKIKEIDFKMLGMKLLDISVAINTKADIVISSNDLIMLINFIIEKERTAYEGKGYVEGTIGKYLGFIVYNSINTSVETKKRLKEEFSKFKINMDKGILLNAYNINGNMSRKLLIPIKVIESCII